MAASKVPEIRRILAENLRVARARLRLSQEDLADAAGVSRGYFGAIERGESACTVDIVESLAKALKLNPGELLTKH